MSFTVYKSSAGSGKTFTLVKEYLKLALTDDQEPPQAYKHILAITFTNKAAGEMKERVINALKELSGSSKKNSTLMAVLMEETGLSADTICSRANRVLTVILHHYSDFAIGTIDSFVHKIVRTFAFDLHLPIAFELEMDANALLSQAIDLLISKAGNDEQLTKILVAFTESKTDDERSWHIENDLLYFAGNLLKDEGRTHIKQLKQLSLNDFFDIRNKLIEYIQRFENTLTSRAQQAIELIHQHVLTANSFYQGAKGIYGYFDAIAKKRFDKLSPNSYVQTTLGEDKWYSGKASDSDKSNIDHIKNQLINHFNNISETVERGNPDYLLFGLINRTIYSLALFNEIEKIVTEVKRENNILHISEFNQLISTIVMNEPTPFIYERLGEKYKNYLIDEFQDTSVLQWQNLLPLIDNSLAENNFTMVVGDGKQAIYRWRGGEVEQFDRLPELISGDENNYTAERTASLKRHFKEKHLNRNFRSKREIIEFNNVFFRTLATKLSPAHTGIYKTLEQEYHELNTGGGGSVTFLPSENYREATLHQLETTIRELMDNGYRLKDIALLVRKNSDGSDIADFLSARAIPVISSESLLLKKSPEVNFMNLFISFIKNGDDAVAQAGILAYLTASGKLNKTTMHDALTATGGNQYQFRTYLAQHHLSFSPHILAKLPLYELGETITAVFGLNDVPNPYVAAFLNELLKYTQRYGNNLHAFSEWWNNDRYQPSLSVPEGINAVNVMTIHRSKGLEFPVVIIPFADWKIGYGKNDLWVSVENKLIPELPSAILPMSTSLEQTIYATAYQEEKNKSLLDNINLLYVAFTRPEERIYILSKQPAKNVSGNNSISDLLVSYYQSTGEWKADKLIYSFGNALAPQPAHEENDASLYELTTFYSSNWQERLKIRANAPSIWDLEDTQTKQDYGILLHNLLSAIEYEDDADTIMKRFQSQGLTDPTQHAQLTEHVKSIISHPNVSPFFSKGQLVKTEREILLPNGDSYRPDRVILNGKKATVIDFKTGKELNKYHRQLTKYANLLSEMGYSPVEKYLIYTTEINVEKID